MVFFLPNPGILASFGVVMATGFSVDFLVTIACRCKALVEQSLDIGPRRLDPDVVTSTRICYSNSNTFFVAFFGGVRFASGTSSSSVIVVVVTGSGAVHTNIEKRNQLYEIHHGTLRWFPTSFLVDPNWKKNSNR